MRIIWIECILFESWCIEASLFILCLKSFIYIKIRHNLFAYNCMLFNLVFLLNSLFLSPSCLFLLCYSMRNIYGYSDHRGCSQQFHFSWTGLSVRTWELSKWAQDASCVRMPAPLFVPFRLPLTCSVRALVMSSFLFVGWDIAAQARGVKLV